MADQPRVTKKRLRLLFACIFILEALVNYDSGAVPAVLGRIREELSLSPLELGLLGGLQYVGLTIMSPVSGLVLQRFPVKITLVLSLLTNTLACLMFALAKNTIMLLIARLLIGLSQAPVIIYAPVWVDEFAPEGSRTTWMSLLQVGIPVGVMLGYTSAGYITNAGHAWQLSLVLQVIALTPFALTAILVPRKYLDLSARTAPAQAAEPVGGLIVAPHVGDSCTPRSSMTSTVTLEMHDFSCNPELNPARQAHDKNERQRLTSDASTAGCSARTRFDSLWVYVEGQQSASHVSIRTQLRILLRCRIYVYITLALSALFFVVTGIQFWVTDYLVNVIGAKYSMVLAGFAVTSATGPPLGVIFGGWFVDRLGGYRGVEGVAVAAKCCACFGLLGVALAIPAGLVDSLVAILVLIWLLLFFGGAIMAPATGLILSSVPDSLRAFSSAMSMLVYNILGYAMGTFLPGMVMQVIQNAGTSPRTTLTWGFRINLFWSVFGLVFMVLAQHVATVKLQKQRQREEQRELRKQAQLRRRQRKSQKRSSEKSRPPRRSSVLVAVAAAHDECAGGAADVEAGMSDGSEAVEARKAGAAIDHEVDEEQELKQAAQGEGAKARSEVEGGSDEEAWAGDAEHTDEEEQEADGDDEEEEEVEGAEMVREAAVDEVEVLRPLRAADVKYERARRISGTLLLI